MSAAIKRLSTIIRPSNSTSPLSPPKESGKNSIDAPAPAAPVDVVAAEPPKAEEVPNGTTTDAVKDAVDSPVPGQETTAAPAPPDDVQDAPSTAEAPKDKDATAPAVIESKKEKEVKTTHRRDPRDIGRSTIRRFSTILRSQAKDTQKDKEPVPPLPSQEDATKPAEGETKAPEEKASAAEEAPKETVAKENGKANSASTEKNPQPAKPAAEAQDKTGTGKVSKRRPSSFFTAAREGLQRTAKDVQTRARGQPRGTKAKAAAKVEAVPKIVKKGAAKGKRVVVITGATKGVGLEFVKQFAAQPNTFVIALSRTAEKSATLKPIVNASAKEGHNVRPIKLDVSSLRSIHNVVKDIVELTDGRIDLLINAAGSRGDTALKVWDLQGSELEDELRNNLIGPIVLTNALVPYLKPMPPKEEKSEEKGEKSDTKEEKSEEQPEAKEEKKEEMTQKKEDKAEEKKEEKAEDKKEEKVVDKEEEKAETGTPEAKSDAQDTVAAAATTAEPSVQALDVTADKQEIATPEAPVEKPIEAPPIESESTEPSAEVPSVLPKYPFVLFLAPSDPIQNVDGSVPTGSTFAPSPRTLFSLSRAALQVAIAKYAAGLGAKGVGIVGVERHGLHDPHSVVSDAESVTGVIKALSDLSIQDNGKLLKTGI